MDPADLPDRWNRAHWAALTERFHDEFRTRTRQEWVDSFDGVDACVTPVLSLREATLDDHAAQRAAFVDDAGFPMPAPAPRMEFPRGRVPAPVSEELTTVLHRWGRD